jgi:hypothetical protein
MIDLRPVSSRDFSGTTEFGDPEIACVPRRLGCLSPLSRPFASTHEQPGRGSLPTFAGTHPSGQVAPEPAVGAREVERVKTTHNSRSSRLTRSAGYAPLQSLAWVGSGYRETHKTSLGPSV